MKNNKKGFTLVELLAVIVILAIILVIAVPQIMKTIDSARLGAFRSTAKLILTQADKQYLVDQTLNVDGTFTIPTWTDIDACQNLTKLGTDYDTCSVTYDTNNKKYQLNLTGKAKFANYKCTNATIDDVESKCNKSNS